MWGIGIKKTYDINAEHVSVKDGILNEDSLVRRYLIFFGLTFLIWEKKYKSNHKINDDTKVGFK